MSQDSAPPPQRSPAVPPSLLRASAGQRLVLAGMISALVWAAVALAMT